MKQEELNRYRPLLAGMVDGELEPEEAAELNEALNRSAELRDEYESICAAAGKLETLSMIEPADEIARRLWRSPYHRTTRHAGIWMIVGGYVLLLFYGIYHALMEEGPVIPKVTIAAMVLGFLMLLFSLISERVKTYKVDPYKEIER